MAGGRSAARAADLNIDSLYLNSAPPLIAGQISRAAELDAITKNGMEEEIERIGCGLRPKERNACREMSRSLEKGEGENHPPRARREMQPNGIYKTIFLHSLNAFVDRRVSSSFLDPRDHRVRVCRPHGSQTMRVMRLSLPSIDFEILPPSPSPWNGDLVFFSSFA